MDKHINLRYRVPSIEGSWVTQRWANRVFSFLLAISEVNTCLIYHHFIWQNPKGPQHKGISLLSFRRRLAMQLIMNEHIVKEEDNKRYDDDNLSHKPSKCMRRHCKIHELRTAPAHAKIIEWKMDMLCQV